MNDQELDEILASLRDQPLPFESVREKVLARTRRKPWAWTLAAAALLLLTFATRPAWRVETRVETMPLPDVAQPKPPVFLRAAASGEKAFAATGTIGIHDREAVHARSRCRHLLVNRRRVNYEKPVVLIHRHGPGLTGPGYGARF